MGAGILTVNVGSSSLKLGVFDASHADSPAEMTISITDIAQPMSRITTEIRGQAMQHTHQVADHAAAVAMALARLETAGELEAISGIGVRVVHGGGRYHTPSKRPLRLAGYQANGIYSRRLLLCPCIRPDDR